VLPDQPIDHEPVKEYILSMPNARLDYPFGKHVEVYKTEDNMFAIITGESDPVRLSLKCDPQLAVLLRSKYESVMPGDRLSKKNWNTIVLSGQLSWSEIQDLIRHSYELANKK
jgi:predicted DNA-binding protein (MmcQ/YjbR family)